MVCDSDSGPFVQVFEVSLFVSKASIKGLFSKVKLKMIHLKYPPVNKQFAIENPSSKYHPNGGFFMAMLAYHSVQYSPFWYLFHLNCFGATFQIV